MDYSEFVRFCSQRALAYEVLFSRKPGLVDRDNNGSHDDMDLYTFMDSNLAIGGYIEMCTLAGQNYEIDEIFKVIRPLGVQAEKDMYKVTGGVNVHKGVIFIFGILAGALGYVYEHSLELLVPTICEVGRKISKDVAKDFDSIDGTDLTYGEDQYKSYGLMGTRGEALSGFKNIRSGYEVFLDVYDRTNDEKISLGQTLLYLMTVTDDSNIIGRGGMSSLDVMKSQAKEAIDLGGYESKSGREYIRKMDDNFRELNISPGGCADMAAAVLMLHWVIEGCVVFS